MIVLMIVIHWQVKIVLPKALAAGDWRATIPLQTLPALRARGSIRLKVGSLSTINGNVFVGLLTLFQPIHFRRRLLQSCRETSQPDATSVDHRRDFDCAGIQTRINYRRHYALQKLSAPIQSGIIPSKEKIALFFIVFCSRSLKLSIIAGDDETLVRKSRTELWKPWSLNLRKPFAIHLRKQVVIVFYSRVKACK